MLFGKLSYLRPLEFNDLEKIRNWRLSKEVSYYFPSFEPISLQKQKEWISNVLLDNFSYYFIICEKNQVRLWALFS